MVSKVPDPPDPTQPPREETPSAVPSGSLPSRLPGQSQQQDDERQMIQTSQQESTVSGRVALNQLQAATPVPGPGRPSASLPGQRRALRGRGPPVLAPPKRSNA